MGEIRDLMKARRRKLAANFTAPHLARYAIDLLIANGIRVSEHRILDPASGGAAFLVPLAAPLASKGRQQGESSKAILDRVCARLSKMLAMHMPRNLKAYEGAFVWP